MTGKNNKTKLVKRTGRVSFYGVPAGTNGIHPHGEVHDIIRVQEPDHL